MSDGKSTEKRVYKPPVAWLFGRQLIASLKGILLYTAFGGKLDSKDWMQAEPISMTDQAEDGEFWFDYLADTGDGQKATYAMAYLCMSDLWIDNAKPQPITRAHLTPGNATKFRLPRGKFLFVGGDTAYHIADERTLRQRIQLPFQWAYQDLRHDHQGQAPETRPIYAIPGNHDYYDVIDGFNRVFRKPFHTSDSSPSLSIPGFEQQQEASFVALELPFGWWFLGIDCQQGKIDKRQAYFFKERIKSATRKKLIVATPEPSTVFGRYASPDPAPVPPGRAAKPLTASQELSSTFKKLGLARPFLEKSEPIADDACRLDISGDVHHYARYWGPARNDSPDAAPSCSNYASLVSGLGGAFLHPSDTDFARIKHQAIYPLAGTSRNAIAAKILNPLNIMRGGYVWLVGGILAVLVYFGLSVPDSSRGLFWATRLREGWPLDWLHQYAYQLPSSHGDELLRSFLLLVFLGCSVYLIYLAGQLRNQVRATSRETTQVHSPQAARDKAEEMAVRKLHGKIALCWVAAVLLPYFALWWFGRHSAVIVISDFSFLIALAFYLVGLAVLGFIGSDRQHSAGSKCALIGLGFGHGIVQLGVPFLLASRFNGLLLLISLTLIPLAALFSYGCIKSDKRGLLVIVFALHGLLQLGLPMFFGNIDSAAIWGVGLSWKPIFFGNARPADSLGLILAFAWGALMSCASFGAYLAVATSMHAHNNEAGGAARIENFKQFVRFRLHREEDDDILSVYVIAVDHVAERGRNLKPKVIDFFELRCPNDRQSDKDS